MVANLSLNQFEPNTPVAGMYVYQANLPQLHNVIVSENENGTLKAGDFVVLDSASTNKNAPVVIKATTDTKCFGVVTYTPMTNSFASGDRIGIARDGDVVWLPANGAIACGAYVTMDSANSKVKPVGGASEIFGIALTPADADGELIQVLIKEFSVG